MDKCVTLTCKYILRSNRLLIPHTLTIFRILIRETLRSPENELDFTTIILRAIFIYLSHIYDARRLRRNEGSS